MRIVTKGAGTSRDLLALCKDVLAEAGEAEAELFVRTTERGCARFAGGELGQHMQLTDPQAVVRVAHGSRVAQALTTRLDRASLVAMVRTAAEAARLVPPIDAFPGFAGSDEPTGESPERSAESTARSTPEERVELLTPVLEAIRAAGLVGAGMLETRVQAQAVATTRGCARAHDGTFSLFKVWALETPGAGGAAGYGGQANRDVRALDLAAETARAIRVCRDSRDPASLDAGTYDVVMEPEAIAELLEWLGTIAFGAPEVEQGTSPMAGRIGERLTGEAVDLLEAPLSSDPAIGFACPFDREGTWRRQVPLIERGIARAVLYDRTCAARMGATSTGSAQPPGPGSEAGVGATSLTLGPGEASDVDELVSGMDRGLYVCRLHYVNGLLEPRRAVMTGLTRDGCFLVERGRIARAVGNMRFTDSLLEGLTRCDAMTRARKAIPTWWSDDGAIVAPAVRMRAFRFNGGSQSAPGT
jgi:PmbA protein